MSTNDPAPRLTRLEESAAFTDLTVEQLSAEVAELARRLHEATTRLARLEESLNRVVGLVERASDPSSPGPRPADPTASGPGTPGTPGPRDQDYLDQRPPHASGRVQGY